MPCKTRKDKIDYRIRILENQVKQDKLKIKKLKQKLKTYN